MPPVRRPHPPRRPARPLVPLVLAAWAAAGGLLRARPLPAQAAGAPPAAAPAGTGAARPDSVDRPADRGAPGRDTPDARGGPAPAGGTARVRFRLTDAAGRPAEGAHVGLAHPPHQ